MQTRCLVLRTTGGICGHARRRLIPWWQIFEPGSLRMIAIHQGKRLVGLAPLFVRYKKGAPWLFPPGRSISDYTDILVDVDCQSTVLKEMAITVTPLRPAWAHWEMAQLAPDAITLAFPSPDRATLTEEPGVACPALCLPDQASSLKPDQASSLKPDQASSLKEVVPASMWRHQPHRAPPQTHDFAGTRPRTQVVGVRTAPTARCALECPRQARSSGRRSERAISRRSNRPAHQAWPSAPFRAEAR
jgi:hypothetical protein